MVRATHIIEESEVLRPCCQETILQHAGYNPMMLCPNCKHIIKCFTREDAFRNYVTFCDSRGRETIVGEFNTYKVVIFKTYETFRA